MIFAKDWSGAGPVEDDENPMSRKLIELNTVDEVCEALGPVRELMTLTQTEHYQTVHNWKRREKQFPSKLHAVMTAELERRGYSAPATLWGQVGSVPTPQPETRAAAHAAAPAG